MSLGSRLATLVLASAALAACAQDPRPAEEGERLWRQAVWNLDSQGFAPAIAHLEQAVRDSAGAPSVRVAFLLASAYVFAGRPEAADPLLPIVRSGPPSPGPMLIDGYEAAMQHVRPDAELALSACLARVGADDPVRDELTDLALL